MKQEYEQQSLLHPGLADTQGPAVSIVLPGAVMTDKQLLKMLSTPTRPLGGDTNSGDGSGSLGRPRMGNGIAALFALTDCLQVWCCSVRALVGNCGTIVLGGGWIGFFIVWMFGSAVAGAAGGTFVDSKGVRCQKCFSAPEGVWGRASR